MLNPHYGRVCAAKHAPRGPFQILERRHGLAEIVERGAVVSVEHPRVFPPHPEREFATLSKSASRHGHLLAQQRLGFFEAPQMIEGRCIVEGGHEGISVFLPIEPHMSREYISKHVCGLFKPFQRLIRVRDIIEQGENVELCA